MVDIGANARTKAGKGMPNRLRKEHKIPGVLYGKGMNNMLVEFAEMGIDDVIRNYGEHAIVNLDINGQKIKTMIKEVQRNPVSRAIEHVDMKYVKDDEKIHADIPVVLKGEGIINSKGWIVQKQLGHISIESTPDRLPRYVTCDVSKLNIGGRLTAADVEVSSDITVITDLHSVIASITTVREKEKTLDSDEQQALDSIRD
jgi:large subunit ribosomal protein L25